MRVANDEVGLVISVARICTGRRKSPVSLKADWAGLRPIPRGTLPRATDYATDYAGFSARACTSSQQHRAAGGRQLTYSSAWAGVWGRADQPAARRLGGHSAGTRRVTARQHATGNATAINRRRIHQRRSRSTRARGAQIFQAQKCRYRAGLHISLIDLPGPPGHRSAMALRGP